MFKRANARDKFWQEKRLENERMMESLNNPERPEFQVSESVRLKREKKIKEDMKQDMISENVKDLLARTLTNITWKSTKKEDMFKFIDESHRITILRNILESYKEFFNTKALTLESFLNSPHGLVRNIALSATILATESVVNESSNKELLFKSFLETENKKELDSVVIPEIEKKVKDTLAMEKAIASTKEKEKSKEKDDSDDNLKENTKFMFKKSHYLDEMTLFRSLFESNIQYAISLNLEDVVQIESVAASNTLITYTMLETLNTMSLIKFNSNDVLSMIKQFTHLK